MISGIINYEKNSEKYLSTDSVFVNHNTILCSDDYKNLSVIGKYVILSDPMSHSAAVYCDSEKSITLLCGNKNMYYTFIGAAMIFSSDINNLIQKCHTVILYNEKTTKAAEIPPQKTTEILKNIVSLSAFDKLTYTQKGLS